MPVKTGVDVYNETVTALTIQVKKEENLGKLTNGENLSFKPK
jgi:hypothetical protein